MGSCYAKHPKNEGNMDIKPKDNSAYENTCNLIYFIDFI